MPGEILDYYQWIFGTMKEKTTGTSRPVRPEIEFF